MKNDVVQSGVTDAAQNRQLHKGLNKEIISLLKWVTLATRGTSAMLILVPLRL